MPDPRDAFIDCCGGNDESPPQHTQDCAKHPPICVLCRKRVSTRTVTLGDAYGQVCDGCGEKQERKLRKG